MSTTHRLTPLSVLVLAPGTETHDLLLGKMKGMKPPRRSERPIPALPEDVALTLLILPVLDQYHLSAARWKALGQAFNPRLVGQYCLETGATPSVRAFGDIEGCLTSYGRIHWFAHWSISEIDRIGASFLDGDGRPVIERILRYGPERYTVAYFGRPADLPCFERRIGELWHAFNSYLEGPGAFPRLTPCTHADCGQGTASITQAAS